MTVVFTNAKILLVDTVGDHNGFGVFTQKLNEHSLNSGREFAHADVIHWCCAGCPNTADEIVHHYDMGTEMVGDLRDTLVFFYDAKFSQTYRLVAAKGRVPVAVPIVSDCLSVWGDGQVAFAQSCMLLDRELIDAAQFGDVYASLWLGDTSRLNHVPSYTGWVDGNFVPTGLLDGEMWEKLKFLATDA